MNLATTRHTAPNGREGPAGLLARLLDHLERARRRRHRHQRVRAELDGYRDAELAELGLTRADVPRIAREAADAV